MESGRSKGQDKGKAGRVMYLYDDELGMPRAWAVGPANREDAIRERAREELKAYISDHGIASAPPTFTLRREELADELGP